jgi:hypothetical protein
VRCNDKYSCWHTEDTTNQHIAIVGSKNWLGREVEVLLRGVGPIYLVFKPKLNFPLTLYIREGVPRQSSRKPLLIGDRVASRATKLPLF